jgi:hypothetical protein
MSDPVDYGQVGYSSGQALGQITTLVVVICLIVWAVRTNRRSTQSLASAVHPVRTPDADMALLSWSITFHVAQDEVAPLVARVMATNPLIEQVPAAGPTWRVGGRHPIIALTPTPGGSLLSVREVLVPLPTPQGAAVWEWVLERVQVEAGRANMHFSRTQQRFVLGRSIDMYRSIWVPAG